MLMQPSLADQVSLGAALPSQRIRPAWPLERLRQLLWLRLRVFLSDLLLVCLPVSSYHSFCRVHDFSLDPTPDALRYMGHFIKPLRFILIFLAFVADLNPLPFRS